MTDILSRRAIVAAALGLLAIVHTTETAFSQTSIDAGAKHLKVRDLYPLVTTPALTEVRDFYVEHFGFQVAFEASWFLYLVGPGEDGTRGATLAFMHPNHPSNPPGPESFDGLGMILTVEVGNAAAVFERLRESGAPIVYPVTDEDWGQRRFMIRDPAGVLVDIVQQIEPAEGYWSRYTSGN